MRFSKVLALVLVSMFVCSSLVFATTYKDAVQDFVNLPTTGNTTADVRMVTLAGEQMTYTTFWFPTRLTRPVTAVTWAGSVQNYSNLPATDADNTCRYVFALKQIFKSTSGVYAVLQPEAVTSATVTSVGGVTAGSTVVAGTGITSTTGDIVATAGAVTAGTSVAATTTVTAGTAVSAGTTVAAGTTVTAGTGITSTTGNITATTGNVVAGGLVVGAGEIIYWNQAVTLQSVINGITDATVNKQYNIIIPPGRFALTTLALKPFVNLYGGGGRGRITTIASTTVSLVNTSLAAGVNRIRIQGIRFETAPITIECDVDAKTILVEMEDCALNGASPIVTHGRTYGAATTMVNLSFRNGNIDSNTANMYELSRVTFWNSTLLGLYFTNSDAYVNGCDISTGANVLNAGTDGGWFEFNNCKLSSMVENDPTSENVLATLCGTGIGNENVQIHGNFRGNTAPGSIAGFTKIQPGAIYFCYSDLKLYVKTGIVGANTWVAQQ